jgi:hypothetical protein
LSLRTIHYALLNDPPLTHASKPDSTYTNTRKHSQMLSGEVTRARFEGLIPMEAINDETRPVATWNAHPNTGGFIRQELDVLFWGYQRDLMQSQPAHIEIVGEKQTLHALLKTVAQKFTIPVTTGRGYCSTPPRSAMYKRFKASGKDRLVILMVGDHDPDGEEIAKSFARSMLRDFKIRNVQAFKIAITPEQIKKYKLIPKMTAKESSSNHDKFVEEHGEAVFEVEALRPDDLLAEVEIAIDRVIDTSAFNAELNAEAHDAAYLQGVRNLCLQYMATLSLDGGKA